MDGNNFDKDLNNNVTPPVQPTQPVMPQPAQPEVPAQPVQPTVQTPVQPVEQPVQPVAEASESRIDDTMAKVMAESAISAATTTDKKRNNKMMIILIAVAAVLVVAMIAILVIMNLPKSSNNGGSGSGEAQGGGSSQDDGPVENTELSAGTVTTTVDGREVTYSAAYLVDGIQATIGSGMYESAVDDQVVFLVVNGGSLTISGEVTINKAGSTDFPGQGDDYSFYGLNSAVVVVGEGSMVAIESGVTITTAASGANAVVAVNGGEAAVTDTTIRTSGNGSRGLHATFGGSIVAGNTDINTQGASSAALATDRGEGTVVANDMVLATEGAGSPLIYSTGEIKVGGSTGTANGAQIAVVEGKNSVEISSCDFSTNGIGNRNNVDNAAVMIYQSMSGDASEGTGSFVATDSTFTILPSSSVYTTTPFLFVTNTTADITLTDVKANFYQDGYFVLASGTNEWGTPGANGATVTISANGLDATNQNIGVDEISSVTGL